MTMPTEAALDPTADPAGAEGGPASGSKNAELVGRYPGQLAWIRIKRDKISGRLCRHRGPVLRGGVLRSADRQGVREDPYTPYGLTNPNLTDATGMPLGSFGGISSQFWLGIEPGGLGRDVFTLLIYGMRTTLTISVIATILSTVIGVGIGLAQGYLGGKSDYWLGRISDLLMAFPQQLFFIAFTPVVIALFYPPGNAVPTWFRGLALIVVQVALGWMGLGRLLRGMTLSLREREFIEAAKIAGASPWRIIRKELMPNLGTTILVQTTLSLSAFVTTEAGLSFLGVGMVDPTPDWGRLFQDAAPYYQTDLVFLLVPGLSLMIFTIAFNLLGDSVRDALDPKTAR